MLESPGQFWKYDALHQIVADVFYDDGKELIEFTNGKEITVETAG